MNVINSGAGCEMLPLHVSPLRRRLLTDRGPPRSALCPRGDRHRSTSRSTQSISLLLPSLSCFPTSSPQSGTFPCYPSLVPTSVTPAGHAASTPSLLLSDCSGLKLPYREPLGCNAEPGRVRPLPLRAPDAGMFLPSA